MEALQHQCRDKYRAAADEPTRDTIWPSFTRYDADNRPYMTRDELPGDLSLPLSYLPFPYRLSTIVEQLERTGQTAFTHVAASADVVPMPVYISPLFLVMHCATNGAGYHGHSRVLSSTESMTWLYQMAMQGRNNASEGVLTRKEAIRLYTDAYQTSTMAYVDQLERVQGLFQADRTLSDEACATFARFVRWRTFKMIHILEQQVMRLFQFPEKVHRLFTTIDTTPDPAEVPESLVQQMRREHTTMNKLREAMYSTQYKHALTFTVPDSPDAEADEKKAWHFMNKRQLRELENLFYARLKTDMSKAEP